MTNKVVITIYSNMSKAQHPSHKPSVYGSRSNQDRTLVKTTLHGGGFISSSAGGVINTYISMDPSVSCTDWADFSATYDEFRVIGCRITMANRQFGVAVNGGLVAVAFDNDSAANPGTFTAVAERSNSDYYAVINSVQPWSKIYWRPYKGGDTAIVWDDVANPSTSLGSIVLYGDSLSASTSYIAYALELYVEFRGRR